MDEVALLQGYLTVGALLFGIGLVGFTSRRNMIIMFLAAEMMLQGISISLVAWGRFHNDWGGQILTIFIITVAACEAAIALALVLMLARTKGGLDIAVWHALREDNHPGYLDEKLPEMKHDEAAWPRLTPAGVEPETNPDEAPHRSHV